MFTLAPVTKRVRSKEARNAFWQGSGLYAAAVLITEELPELALLESTEGGRVTFMVVSFGHYDALVIMLIRIFMSCG